MSSSRGKLDSEKDSIDISVVIPVAQYSGDLEQVYLELSKEFERIGKSYEFIFIDDGGGSENFETLRQLNKKYPQLKVVRLGTAFGETVAFSVGFERAKGDLIITSNSYLQTEPADIHKILKELNDGYDLVTAWRYPRIDPALNRWQSSVFNWVTRKMTKVPFHDLNCGLRGMRKGVIEAIPIYGDLFRFLPVLAFRQGFRVKEVKVEHLEERGETGLYGIGAYIRRLLDILTLFFLIKFTKKPLRFFGLVGSGLFGIGFAINVYLTIVKIMGNAIANRPLLLLGVLLLVVGIQTLSLGLVGEIIVFTHAREIKEYTIDQILE